jgi:predicted ATP-dependent serine protease
VAHPWRPWLINLKSFLKNKLLHIMGNSKCLNCGSSNFDFFGKCQSCGFKQGKFDKMSKEIEKLQKEYDNYNSQSKSRPNMMLEMKMMDILSKIMELQSKANELLYK